MIGINMRKIGTLLFVIIIGSLTSYSQEIDPDTVRIHLITPREAVYLHSKYVQQETFYPEIAAKAMDINRKEHLRAAELAVMLKKIMDAKSLIINISKIPNDTLVMDSTSGRYIFYPFRNMPEIYLERVGTKWKYSRFTCDNIDVIYDKLFLFHLNHFVETLPPFFKNSIGFGVNFWQILAFIALLVAGFVVKILGSLLGRLLCKTIFGRTRFRNFFENHILRNVNTLATILGLVLIYILLPNIELPVKINFVLSIIFKGLIPLFATIIMFRMADYISERIQRKRLEKLNKVHENFLPFLRTTFKVVIVIIGLLFIMVSLGVEILPLIAGLSIGGIAIALAAQETIKNIFGSITVFTDRPFDVGDWIIFQDGEGTVEEIGVRSTRIRSFNNSIITVPNGKLMDMTIDNMGRRDYRRYVLNLEVDVTTPIELLETFIDGIRVLIQKHPITRNDLYYVYLVNMTSAYFQILVQTYFVSEDMDGEYKAKQIFLTDIIKLARELGIRFALPAQSLQIHKAETEPEFIPADPKEYKRKLDQFFESRKTDSGSEVME
jgi:MscS family membrane protein